jgi:hypothetical protein
MGCGASAGSKVEINPVVVEGTDFKQIHSSIRWNKPIREIESLLDATPGCHSFSDPVNGNYPIHIAAQNGHTAIVNLLIARKVDLNAKNGKGNTGIHMAVGYDYYECARALIDAGGDATIVNEDGIPGNRGLEGDKSVGIAALMSASTVDEVDAAFAICDTEIEALKFAKAQFIKAALQAKKAVGLMWKDEQQEKLKSINKQL